MSKIQRENDAMDELVFSLLGEVNVKNVDPNKAIFAATGAQIMLLQGIYSRLGELLERS